MTNNIKSQDYITAIKTVIVQDIVKYFQTNQLEYDITSKEKWNPIFDNLKYQIRYYLDIRQDISYDREITVYPSETFDQYISDRVNIIKLGPYDYMEFYKNMQNDEFAKSIKKAYKKGEKLKNIKNELIYESLVMMNHPLINTIQQNTRIEEPIETINAIPFYEYVSIHDINVDEEPVYKDFRDNKQEFYERYTLWYMNQVIQ
jgi:hypothetical protein